MRGEPAIGSGTQKSIHSLNTDMDTSVCSKHKTDRVPFYVPGAEQGPCPQILISQVLRNPALNLFLGDHDLLRTSLYSVKILY